ncbi:GNAT family N-acetyltransferase [Halorarum salinum]|uniref:GNAT family N-acetyltransferase n=1 Tax=Halorarum salinum TaxID=2743089 RepID=A0A7D5LBA8_9EURY|nr:GNAT family N-acetyltransferase [Halobaculum salinum]QLG62451.1 GNAT family N-acetyltransferase [Halobaculum salinum]
MEGVTVEPATMDDVDALADRWVALAAGQRAHGSSLLADENRPVARDAVARHVVTGGLLVARGPDGVRGFVMFAPETGSYEEDVDRGVVTNLYVDPEHREGGLGGRLLAEAEAALAAEGADVVSLEAMADNRAARRFYAGAGYHEHRITFEKRLGTGENDTDSREGE